jgi:transposase
MKNYIGVDLGTQSSYFVIKNEHGNKLAQMKVFNDRASITKAVGACLKVPCQAVMEACCNYYWMYQELTRLGIEVILAHPLKTRAIADAKVKNDRLDANMLCDLLRANLIPQSYIPTERIRHLRELTRQHIRLVQIRTRIKNQFHSLLTKLNLRPTERMTDAFGKKGRDWLKQMRMPDVFDFQKGQLLDQLEYYNRLIYQIDKKITHTLQDYPEAGLLVAIPGIGSLGAAMLIAEIGEIKRFHFAKQLVGYAGIAPGLYESGKTRHPRSITHEGNRFLRWILCQMTQHHIQKPGPLRDFYLRLKDKKGHGKAVVATARKFLIQIFYVLKEERQLYSVSAG